MLVNGDLEWSQILKHIRQQLLIEPNCSVNFFSDDCIIGGGQVSSIYEKYKKDDGVLYLQFLKI